MRFGHLKRRWYILGAIVIAGGVTAGVVLASSGTTSAKKRSYAYMKAAVPAGVTPHQPEAVLEKRALDALGPASYLNSVRVIASRIDLPQVIPGSGHPPASEAVGGVTWIIRAHGLFQRVTTPPGAAEVTTPRDGFIVFDDATGKVIEYGWP
jgi:hypothetical protein